jgi:YVTN family beta-propeller protein
MKRRKSWHCVAIMGVCLIAANAQPAANKKPGVPAVQRPLSALVPDAVISVPGSPDWIGIDESVWISNSVKNNISRIDPKTNKVVTVVDAGKKPCAGVANAFGSLWTPVCGDKKLARIDPKTGRVTASIPMEIPDSEGMLAAGFGSIWIMTDKNGALARVDPAQNKIIAKIAIAPGSFDIVAGEGAIWVTSIDKNLVTRVDPATNRVAATIPVGKTPRFLAAGEGSVWALNQGDGSVSRIDAKTNKLVATIEVGVPGEGGDIAVGEGAVWVTAIDVPMSRIDPKTNRVVAQFAGPGGDATRVAFGSVWLSNHGQQNVWRLDPKKIVLK